MLPVSERSNESLMKKEFENGRAVVAALFAVCVASAAIPQSLQAQATILTACYVPDVGVVYRIKAAGLPDECTETTHVEFSWNMEGPAGPQGTQGDQAISLWANVSNDGTLINGTATNAARMSEGFYEVTFGQGVSECAPIATSGISTNAGGANPNAIASASVAPVIGENTVWVGFRDSSGDADTDFHLVVAC